MYSFKFQPYCLSFQMVYLSVSLINHLLFPPVHCLLGMSVRILLLLAFSTPSVTCWLFSMITMNYVGTHGHETGLAGAMVLSAPMETFSSAHSLERGLNMPLNTHLTKGLIEGLRRLEGQNTVHHHSFKALWEIKPVGRQWWVPIFSDRLKLRV